MYNRSARFYDLLYEWKDYQSEVSYLRDIIKHHAPEARTILDVACGTGEHAKFLKTDYLIEGIDLESEFLEIARAKNPECKWHQGNMIDFDLGKQFDVVMCLFSSIGFIQMLDNVTKVLANFVRHKTPCGIILVEPWLEPSAWLVGNTYMTTSAKEGIKICRMALNEKEGSLSKFTHHYLVADQCGVQYFSETHLMGLFTSDEMNQAFSAANLNTIFDSQGLNGMGLYIGR
jgi:ubiquinone/menaquinone biosynthesis C-methylase UbiE